MSTETQRADFEAFVIKNLGDVPVMDDGRYISPKIHNYWLTWQAAQASQAAEIEALKTDIDTYVRAASERATEIEHLKDVLGFVERWANHHARKPSVSAVEALSVIQHHPAIKEITKSYSDGVVPATRDPYAEIEALRKDAELWQYWRPWLERRLGDLSKYNAAMQTKEAT